MGKTSGDRGNVQHAQPDAARNSRGREKAWTSFHQIAGRCKWCWLWLLWCGLVVPWSNAPVVSFVWLCFVVWFANAQWEKQFTEDGDKYYSNDQTGETGWDAPPGSTGGSTGVAAAAEGGLLGSNHARSDTKLPSGWGKDKSGEDSYYYNEETGETSWTAPEGSTKDGDRHPDLNF